MRLKHCIQPLRSSCAAVCHALRNLTHLVNLLSAQTDMLCRICREHSNKIFQVT